MAIKTQRLYYMARNMRTGLSDVTADVYKDGVSTPVDTDVNLSELDDTNTPGLYILELTDTALNGYGGVGTYVAHINSASRNAPATVKFEVLANDNDDLMVKLLAMEAKIDTLQAGQTAMQSDVTSIKATVEDSNSVLNDGNIGNANLKALIEQVISAVSSVQNNTRFVGVVPARMVVPATPATTNTYRVDIRLFDNEGNPEDPDTDQIQVSVANESGTDRTNLLQGYTSGPVNAIKDGVGIYYIDVNIADTSALEQLRFTFDYAETNDSVTVNQSHPRMSETVVEAEASGLALQATLLDVLTDTADMQPKTSTILNMVNDVTSGLPALKALIDIVDSVADANNAELTSASHGLSAIKAVVDAGATQVSVDAINTALTNDVKGAGFDNTTDSLKEISDRTYFGGQAI
ncbi:MAG: hypothetical protein HRU18_01695 [Pseudoalteromonas sp.]|uniref:hypothetical protein n=1 Tax=Pseudoalteromonas sp. TaxID=53249 RepID=UPI001D1D8508|nr:hypothetical protein [Pseudoalteromonas sp.]NRA76895.1 hypothetical protein [Pseudoalteromonas sp.]